MDYEGETWEKRICVNDLFSSIELGALSTSGKWSGDPLDL